MGCCEGEDEEGESLFLNLFISFKRTTAKVPV